MKTILILALLVIVTSCATSHPIKMKIERFPYSFFTAKPTKISLAHEMISFLQAYKRCLLKNDIPEDETHTEKMKATISFRAVSHVKFQSISDFHVKLDSLNEKKERAFQSCGEKIAAEINRHNMKLSEAIAEDVTAEANILDKVFYEIKFPLKVEEVPEGNGMVEIRVSKIDEN